MAGIFVTGSTDGVRRRTTGVRRRTTGALIDAGHRAARHASGRLARHRPVDPMTRRSWC